jgi:hypothetical protein
LRYIERISPKKETCDVIPIFENIIAFNIFYKKATGRAGGFEVLANPKGGAPIGGFTIQNLIALLDAL